MPLLIALIPYPVSLLALFMFLQLPLYSLFYWVLLYLTQIVPHQRPTEIPAQDRRTQFILTTSPDIIPDLLL